MYIGVVVTPLLLVVFVAHYTDEDDRLTRSRVAALSVVPAATPVAVRANPLHGRFYTTVDVEHGLGQADASSG
ncbi:hypothetical protein BRD02_02955 [Halobacteriales archaeon QS_8_69_73]|nr:MAG: hypothetical protein BRD02_02955 [Halobacteriales archaeon QS_8_69_73]